MGDVQSRQCLAMDFALKELHGFVSCLTLDQSYDTDCCKCFWVLELFLVNFLEVDFGSAWKTMWAFLSQAVVAFGFKDWLLHIDADEVLLLPKHSDARSFFQESLRCTGHIPANHVETDVTLKCSSVCLSLETTFDVGGTRVPGCLWTSIKWSLTTWKRFQSPLRSRIALKKCRSSKSIRIS